MQTFNIYKLYNLLAMKRTHTKINLVKCHVFWNLKIQVFFGLKQILCEYQYEYSWIEYWYQCIHLPGITSNCHNEYKEKENDSVDVKSYMKQYPDNLYCFFIRLTKPMTFADCVGNGMLNIVYRITSQQPCINAIVLVFS